MNFLARIYHKPWHHGHIYLVGVVLHLISFLCDPSSNSSSCPLFAFAQRAVYKIRLYCSLLSLSSRVISLHEETTQTTSALCLVWTRRAHYIILARTTQISFQLVSHLITSACTKTEFYFLQCVRVSTKGSLPAGDLRDSQEGGSHTHVTWKNIRPWTRLETPWMQFNWRWAQFKKYKELLNLTVANNHWIYGLFRNRHILCS